MWSWISWYRMWTSCSMAGAIKGLSVKTWYNQFCSKSHAWAAVWKINGKWGRWLRNNPLEWDTYAPQKVSWMSPRCPRPPPAASPETSWASGFLCVQCMAKSHRYLGGGGEWAWGTDVPQRTTGLPPDKLVLNWKYHESKMHLLHPPYWTTQLSSEQPTPAYSWAKSSHAKPIYNRVESLMKVIENCTTREMWSGVCAVDMMGCNKNMLCVNWSI